MCLSYTSSYSQESNDTSYLSLLPSIVVKCDYNKELGWIQVASIEAELQVSNCPIDSIHVIAFDTTNSISDTIFNLFSNQVQINPDKNACWFPGLLKAEISIYQNGSIVSLDTFNIQVSLLEYSKKCACGSGKDGTSNSGIVGFGKASLEYDKNRKNAEKIGLNKKRYSSEFIEYNYDNGKIVKVDKLNRTKGKFYIDETHLSTRFSRNNNFPEAKYNVIKNEGSITVLSAECRREDGDLMIWKIVIQGKRMDITASWYRDGEIRTTYLVMSKN